MDGREIRANSQQDKDVLNNVKIYTSSERRVIVGFNPELLSGNMKINLFIRTPLKSSPTPSSASKAVLPRLHPL